MLRAARSLATPAASMCVPARWLVVPPFAATYNRAAASSLSRAPLAVSADTAAAPDLMNDLVKPLPRVRLDVLLAQCGFASRRDARQFCRAAEVVERTPGAPERRIMTGGTKVDPAHLYIDGEPVEHTSRALHLVLHKPVGVVCSHDEDGEELIYDLLPDTFMMRKPTLASIGRLDKMASGILLLTQNGALNARLTSPRRHCPKEYLISLAAPLSSAGLEAAAFATGKLRLADGSCAKPAVLRPHATFPNVCKVTLTEGRYHQLRRMFAAVGHTVTGIHRTAFAGLQLADMRLAPGEWRALTDAELQTALDASQQTTTPTKSARGGRFRLRTERPRWDDFDELADMEDLNAGGGEGDDDLYDVDVDTNATPM